MGTLARLFSQTGLAALLAAFASGAGQAQQPATPATIAPAIKSVPSVQFHATRGATTLIDVREANEWDETGLPAGARGVSLSCPNFIDGVLREAGGDKSKPVAVICRSGARSTKAAAMLSAAGFTNVTNVNDGMMGWAKAGLPT